MAVMLGYTNESNPFGDTNLTKNFVWRKKIERDLINGLNPRELSLKARKKRQVERMAEIEKVKKRREDRVIEKAQHEEEMAMLARERARAEFRDWEMREEEFHSEQNKLRSEIRLREERAKPIDSLSLEVDKTNLEMKMATVLEERDPAFRWSADRPRKPTYVIHVLTGYDWNKYNQIHYDQDNPPPKSVRGYKFKILYPDLFDQQQTPTYVLVRDESIGETCMIRFRAGPPYQDVAFRIVNKEWEYSPRKGFKCTFEKGILSLHFNFLRCRYRR